MTFEATLTLHTYKITNILYVQVHLNQPKTSLDTWVAKENPLSLLVLQVSLLRTEGKLQSGGREELADWLHRRYCCHGDRDSGFAGNAEKNRFGRTSVKSHALNFRGMLLNPFNT